MYPSVKIVCIGIINADCNTGVVCTPGSNTSDPAIERFILAPKSAEDGDEVEGSGSDAVVEFSTETTPASCPSGAGRIKSPVRSGFGVRPARASPTKGGVTAAEVGGGNEVEEEATVPTVVMTTTQHEQLMQNESVRKFLACSR